MDRKSFDISYVDGSRATGHYFTDSFEIGGVVMENLTMGLGAHTDIGFGVVGIGFASNEAIVQTKGVNEIYNNLPLAMVEQGLVNASAYSLWLNNLDASTGHVMFGGIDTEKYLGEMTRVPLQPGVGGNISEFTVAITSLTASSSSGIDELSSIEQPINAVLDSGTTLTYLPQDVADQVWQEVGAEFYTPWQIAVLPCSMATSAGNFTFGFGGPSGPRITIGMGELVLPVSTVSLKFPSGKYEGEEMCQFGIQNITGVYILGDTFLRSAYVVYDLTNKEIGLAATDFDAISSNAVAFPSFGATIPSATAVVSLEESTKSAFSEPGLSLAAAEGFPSLGFHIHRDTWTMFSVVGATMIVLGWNSLITVH